MNATTNAAELPAPRCVWCVGTGRFSDHDCRLCLGTGIAQSQQEPVALTTMPTSEEVFIAAHAESNQSHQDFVRGVQWLQRKLKEASQ